MKNGRYSSTSTATWGSETLAQPRGERAGQFGRGQAARRHGADQRQGDVAGGIHGIAVGQSVLAEHHHPETIAGIEGVGRDRRAGHQGDRGGGGGP
jgi:hypothetical protein